MPFTQEDFDPQLAHALELMPDLLGDEGAEIRYAINGLISMTPDGHPLLGELPEIRGLWSAAASWIKEGPGCGRAVAELMSGLVPAVDVHEADAARFYPHQRTVAHVRARAREGFNKMYGIVHPAEQWESGRPVRVSPLYERDRSLGAVFYETAGWSGRSGTRATPPCWSGTRAGDGPLGRMGLAWWSPVINAEHLAMRDACGLVDLSAFAVFDVFGPGALDAVQHLSVAQLNVAARPGGLHVVDGPRRRVPGRPDRDAAWPGPLPGGDRRRDRHVRRQLVRRHLPAGAFLADLTSAWTTIGLWGPRARDCSPR